LAMKAILAIFAVIAIVASAERFDGHKVLRLSLNERDPLHLTAYRNMRDVVWPYLDWWTDTDVRVVPEQLEEITTYLSMHRITYSTYIEDVQALVDAEEAWHLLRQKIEANRTDALLGSTGPNPAPDYFKDYRRLNDIKAFYDGLRNQYPSLTKALVIGKSYENRDQFAVQITSAQGGSKKIGIVFEGGIHSREWISHAVVAYLAWSLLDGYGKDADVTKFLDTCVFTIIAAVNPDGYEATWSGERMWRKTRSPNPGSSCKGTDPNRNWDNHWCVTGASRDPCSDSYCGRAAFSESETKNVGLWVKAQGNIKGFIDFHSYSQLWMCPYGWTATRPKDYTAQMAVGNAAVAAIKAKSGLTYRAGSIYTIIYPASGSSADYAYDTANVTYPYGVELRDTGASGFLLPASQIIPCSEEIWAAVKTMVNYIITH